MPFSFQFSKVEGVALGVMRRHCVAFSAFHRYKRNVPVPATSRAVQSVNYKPGSVNISRLPKNKRNIKHSVWSVKEFRGLFKN